MKDLLIFLLGGFLGMVILDGIADVPPSQTKWDIPIKVASKLHSGTLPLELAITEMNMLAGCEIFVPSYIDPDLEVYWEESTLLPQVGDHGVSVWRLTDARKTVLVVRVVLNEEQERIAFMHGLGHVLGLPDAPAASGAATNVSIMAPRTIGHGHHQTTGILQMTPLVFLQGLLQTE